MGIGAHALDELQRPATADEIPAACSSASRWCPSPPRAGSGSRSHSTSTLWLLPFVALGALLVPVYSLELLRRRDPHRLGSRSPGAPSRCSPATSPADGHDPGRGAARSGGATCCRSSQRSLSTPARRIRRRRRERRRVTLPEVGSRTAPDPRDLSRAPERALRLMCTAVYSWPLPWQPARTGATVLRHHPSACSPGLIAALGSPSVAAGLAHRLAACFTRAQSGHGARRRSRRARELRASWRRRPTSTPRRSVGLSHASAQSRCPCSPPRSGGCRGEPRRLRRARADAGDGHAVTSRRRAPSRRRLRGFADDLDRAQRHLEAQLDGLERSGSGRRSQGRGAYRGRGVRARFERRTSSAASSIACERSSSGPPARPYRGPRRARGPDGRPTTCDRGDHRATALPRGCRRRVGRAGRDRRPRPPRRDAGRVGTPADRAARARHGTGDRATRADRGTGVRRAACARSGGCRDPAAAGARPRGRGAGPRVVPVRADRSLRPRKRARS